MDNIPWASWSWTQHSPIEIWGPSVFHQGSSFPIQSWICLQQSFLWETRVHPSIAWKFGYNPWVQPLGYTWQTQWGKSIWKKWDSIFLIFHFRPIHNYFKFWDYDQIHLYIIAICLFLGCPLSWFIIIFYYSSFQQTKKIQTYEAVQPKNYMEIR